MFKGLALPVKDRIQTVGELIELFDAASKPAEAEKKQPVNSAAALKEKRQTENAAAKKAPNKKAIYIIAAILALGVCISFFIFVSPRHKIIARGSCGGSAGWSLTEDGTLTISGTGAMENYSDKSAQGWYGHAGAINSVIISDGITHIGSRAFSACSALTEITIPNSVTNIGSYVFSYCSALTEITLSNSVTNIGKFAFYGCKALTEITIPDSVTSIGRYVFSGCSSLTEITIPDSVTSINDYSFFDCKSLTKITIPDSVTSIGYGAFSLCDNLSDVYYGGSQSDWSKIEIYDSDNCLTNAKIHFNSAMPET